MEDDRQATERMPPGPRDHQPMDNRRGDVLPAQEVELRPIFARRSPCSVIATGNVRLDRRIGAAAPIAIPTVLLLTRGESLTPRRS
jgi:hypothetical protein